MIVTNSILLFTCAISIYAMYNADVMNRLIYNTEAFFKGDYYRALTSAFVHAGWGHLLLNMISFWSFSGPIERAFQMRFPMGSTCYLLFYIAAIIVSELPSILKQRDNRNYRTLGASGAISAVIFSCMVLSPTTQMIVMFIPMPAFVFGPVYLLYTAWASQKQPNSGINHDAHMYGALFGIAATVLLFPGSFTLFFQQVGAWLW
ncbi:MAG: rhomboid family intramembrane serine protease [Bacteroidota bacterium]